MILAIENEYYEIDPKQVESIISKDEKAFYKRGGYRIAQDDYAGFMTLTSIQTKAIAHINANKDKFHPRVAVSCDLSHKYTTYGRSDGMSDTLCPADGKVYDSKSAYEKAVKDAGLVIMGNDAPKTKPSPKAKEIDWKQAVAETLKTTPLKGKKR